MKTLLLSTALLMAITSAEAQNQVVVNTAGGNVKINKNIYGHFAEHLGACIYNGIYIGETEKNISTTDGVRNDIITALKKLKVPVLRWPGGCFADTYNWKDGIGPKHQRPSMVNRWWGGVTEDNSFGTHDFLNFCEAINAEPYLAGNIATQPAQTLIDWDQYVNGAPGTSPMAKLREQNGRKEPWNVSFWGVGNEAWGCGGNMKPEYYVDRYRLYATFLSSWSNDNKVFRIASGANSADYNWTETLMKGIGRNLMEGLALHHYSVINWGKKGPATGFTEEQYAITMREAWKMEELVSRHSQIMDKYDPQKRIALIVDEWGGWYEVEPGTNQGFLYQQNTMRDAMIAGITLNIFNNHADRVRMANLAQIVNVLQAVILTKEEKMILTPTYHVMEMYNVHQDATLLPVTVKAEDYVQGDTKLPSVSVSASKSTSATHITLTNIDPGKSRTINLELKNGNFKTVSGRILASKSIQDYNSFDQPSKIAPKPFNGAIIKEGTLSLTMPPASVIVLKLN